MSDGTTPKESAGAPSRVGIAGMDLLTRYQPTPLHEVTVLARQANEQCYDAGYSTLLLSAAPPGVPSSPDPGGEVSIFITPTARPDFTYQWLVGAELSLSHIWPRPHVETAPFPFLFDRVREATALPVATLAILMGAPRRTLYHWRSTGHAPDSIQAQVRRLSHWTDEVQRRAPGLSLRAEFDPAGEDTIGALLKERRDDEELEERLESLLEPQLPKRARRVTDEESLEIEDLSMSQEQVRAALQAFSASREGQPRQGAWIPLEVTDSKVDDAG